MKALLRTAVEAKYAERLGVPASRAMRCLACQCELSFNSRGWCCEDCGGELWLLSRLSSAHHETLTKYLTDHALPMEFPAKGRPCPGCREAFAVVEAPRSASDEGRSSWARTRVDVCLLCQWVWLDPGELREVNPRFKG